MVICFPVLNFTLLPSVQPFFVTHFYCSVVPDAVLVPHRVLDRVLDPALRVSNILAYLVRPHWTRAVCGERWSRKMEMS